MKLQEQLNNITESNGGYNFNVNGIYQWYSDMYQLLFQFYTELKLFQRDSPVDDIKTILINEYDICKAINAPSEVQLDFVSDYDYFIN